VFNGRSTLRFCLQALAESSLAAAQCLVVDDGSTDGSDELAESMGATVLSTGGRFGPAAARNLGARHATGEVLLFIDADVAIHPDALERIRERFSSDPDLDALIGSYDDAPPGNSFVSQFKNLQHSFVHHEGNRRASGFWCGCGAIKRSVYSAYGGLDESYRRASIEDIELGFRLMRAGRKLALDPSIECKHLKTWTFWGLVRTDVLERGLPWTILILRTRFLPDDLNLRWSQRFSVILSMLLVALTGLELGIVSAGSRSLHSLPAIAAITADLGCIYVLNRNFYAFLASRKGWGFTFGAIWLHLLYFLYSGVSFVLGVGLFLYRILVPAPRRTGYAPTAASENEQP
jgi:glycosyltransferase involved in cell wall biosynthesis